MVLLDQQKLPKVMDEEAEARAKRKADKQQKLIDSVHFYRHQEREQKQQGTHSMIFASYSLLI
jgi:hypothetical protein